MSNNFQSAIINLHAWCRHNDLPIPKVEIKFPTPESSMRASHVLYNEFSPLLFNIPNRIEPSSLFEGFNLMGVKISLSHETTYRYEVREIA